MPTFVYVGHQGRFEETPASPSFPVELEFDHTIPVGSFLLLRFSVTIFDDISGIFASHIHDDRGNVYKVAYSEIRRSRIWWCKVTNEIQSGDKVYVGTGASTLSGYTIDYLEFSDLARISGKFQGEFSGAATSLSGQNAGVDDSLQLVSIIINEPSADINYTVTPGFTHVGELDPPGNTLLISGWDYKELDIGVSPTATLNRSPTGSTVTWCNMTWGGYYGNLSVVRHPLMKNLILATDDLLGNINVEYWEDEEGGEGSLGSVSEFVPSEILSLPTLDVSPNGTLWLIVTRADEDTLVVDSAIYRSDDQGRTWEFEVQVAPSTDNYRLATGIWTKSMDSVPILVVGLYKFIPDEWWIKIGTIDATGALVFSSAVRIATSAREVQAAFIERPDGALQFMYTKTDLTVDLLTCENLKSDGTGTWS